MVGSHQCEDVVDGPAHPEGPVAGEDNRPKHVVPPQFPHATYELGQASVEQGQAKRDLARHSMLSAFGPIPTRGFERPKSAFKRYLPEVWKDQCQTFQMIPTRSQLFKRCPPEVWKDGTHIKRHTCFHATYLVLPM